MILACMAGVKRGGTGKERGGKERRGGGLSVFPFPFPPRFRPLRRPMIFTTFDFTRRDMTDRIFLVCFVFVSLSVCLFVCLFVLRHSELKRGDLRKGMQMQTDCRNAAKVLGRVCIMSRKSRNTISCASCGFISDHHGLNRRICALFGDQIFRLFYKNVLVNQFSACGFCLFSFYKVNISMSRLILHRVLFGYFTHIVNHSPGPCKTIEGECCSIYCSEYWVWISRKRL